MNLEIYILLAFPVNPYFVRKFLFGPSSNILGGYIVQVSSRPFHEKKCLREYAETEVPDQSVHLRSLIRAFTVC